MHDQNDVSEAMRTVLEDIREHAWIVPKIPHDDSMGVGPLIRPGLMISREAGVSDVEHTRRYAAQLLAAADEAERDEGGAVRPYIGRPGAELRTP